MKKRLDDLINKNSEVSLTAWTLHDLRRTVRTRMSALGVPPHIAELVIGHKQAGIQAVYDLHTYDKEKYDALNAWADRLQSIIENYTPPKKTKTSALFEDIARAA